MGGTCPQLCCRQGAEAGLEPRFPVLLTDGQGGRLSGLGQRHLVGGVEDRLAPALRTSVSGPLPASCPLPPPGALEIGQALPIHTGRYTCTAQNSAGVAHKHVALTVQGRVPRSFSSHGVALGRGAGKELAVGGAGAGGEGPAARCPELPRTSLPHGTLGESPPTCAFRASFQNTLFILKSPLSSAQRPLGGGPGVRGPRDLRGPVSLQPLPW